jgi:hypothetical protein
MLHRRKPQDCLPSHTSVMGVIMKYLSMCGPDGMDRFEFKRRFEKAKKDLGKDDSARLVHTTPISRMDGPFRATIRWRDCTALVTTSFRSRRRGQTSQNSS